MPKLLVARGRGAGAGLHGRPAAEPRHHVGRGPLPLPELRTGRPRLGDGDADLFELSEGTHTVSGTVFLPSSRFLFAVRGVFRTRRVSYEECFVRGVLRSMRAAAIYTSHYPFL